MKLGLMWTCGVVALVMVGACGTGSSDDAASETNADTGAPTTGSESGDETAGATEASESDGGPTGGSGESGGSGSDGPTGTDDAEMPSGGLDTGGDGFLDGCAIDAPCPAVEWYCDYDGCAADFASPETDCVYTTLAASWDGTVARLDISSAECSDCTLATIGDGTVLIENADDVVRSCQLKTQRELQACVGNEVDDTCYDAFGTTVFGSCEDVEPACPQ